MLSSVQGQFRTTSSMYREGCNADKKEEDPHATSEARHLQSVRHLSCPFLLELTIARGFGQKWCRWISALSSTATSRILLNGHQGPPIRHYRGVRQGDSLSPMLFIIAMDVITMMVAKACDDGVLRPMEPQGVKFQCTVYMQTM